MGGAWVKAPEGCRCMVLEETCLLFFFSNFGSGGWAWVWGKLYYESQPVGLAEVISASEASLGGPGGRASQMYKNRVK